MKAAFALQWLRGSLAASGLRLALAIGCIALGVALGGAVHTVHSSALAEIEGAARAISGTADLEIRGALSGFDERIFLDVASRPEVAVASPGVEVQAAQVKGGVVRVLGLDALRAVRLQPAFVADAGATGAGEAASLLDPSSAWLTPPLAARLGLAKDAAIALRAGTATRAFRIAGTLALEGAGDVLVMDIAAAQEAFGRVGRLTRIDVRLAPGIAAAKAKADLERVLPPGVVVSEASATRGRAAGLSRAYRVNLDALALVALATGAFLVYSTLALQAARRRQELALLRALGLTRGDVVALLTGEGALLGLVGAVFGTGLGLVGSRVLLDRVGADLGAGFFGSQGNAFAPDPLGLAGIAAIGVAMSMAGAWQVARRVSRIDVAEALRDRALDLPPPAGGLRNALLFAAAGVPFLFAPPVSGLPLGGYVAIGLWLSAAVAAVGPACRALLSRLAFERDAAAALAVAQVRHLPGHLAASVAGIVVSASLCIAMAIMVHSFRVSLEEWLEGVVRGDLYVGAREGGHTTYFTAEEVARVAKLPGVASVDALRFDRLALRADAAPVTLVARPIDEAILRGFQAQPPGLPARGAEVPVWISEAARDLEGWKPGDVVSIPLRERAVPVRVAGVIRDFGRTWGSVMMPVEDYRRLTGDTTANDLVLHVERGVETARVADAIRALLPKARGLGFEDAKGLRERSLEIFDRSFAVTYALEAVAIAIGLAGITSSFAALAWSRRREFGVLRFLGFTRGEVLRMLALEGAAAGLLGAALGLASGVATSFVLVDVVNRQSFHWSLGMHWPFAAMALLLAALVAACAIGARASGAFAVRREAVLAVKDDA